MKLLMKSALRTPLSRESVRQLPDVSWVPFEESRSSILLPKPFLLRLTSKRPSGGGGGIAQATVGDAGPPASYVTNLGEAGSQPKQRAGSLFFPKIAANSSSSSSTSPGGGAREAKLPACRFFAMVFDAMFKETFRAGPLP